MKKFLAVILMLAMVLMLVACGGQTAEEPAEGEAEGEGEKIYKIALMLPYIGDASFFDSMEAGRQELEARDNVETTLIEMGTDQTRWESYFDDACDGDVKYDLIASGSSEVEPFLYEAAQKYPEQLFFNYDYNAAEDCDNVYGVTYKTSEIGYLAGLVSALITTSDMEGINEDAKVGVVVGMDTSYMNDFIGSFCQVCNEYDVQVYIGYPASATPFADPAQGLELASAM
ncbi:MAG: BMP family ABC transporter substrate-binding protein, partial [Oscillospiraceae bacterium]|nr:BMP family ABC transporter substrate-binding protein [Oscillospiraceae bacterium]